MTNDIKQIELHSRPKAQRALAEAYKDSQNVQIGTAVNRADGKAGAYMRLGLDQLQDQMESIARLEMKLEQISKAETELAGSLRDGYKILQTYPLERGEGLTFVLYKLSDDEEDDAKADRP